MTEGIYKLNFESGQKQLGSGLAAFKNGEVRGGNTEFLYFGSYQLTSQKYDSSISFNADVTIQYYKGINLAIFGKLTRFSVDFSGVFSSNTLFADNKTKNDATESITLKGIKIDDFKDNLLIDNNSFDFTAIKDANLLKTAISLYKDGEYIDATNTVISMLDVIICQLLLVAKKESKTHYNFLDRVAILAEGNIISKETSCLLMELVANEKMLSKKLNSPNSCAFPLYIIAFNSLNTLLSSDNDIDGSNDTFVGS